jgi:hypothetical protein
MKNTIFILNRGKLMDYMVSLHFIYFISWGVLDNGPLLHFGYTRFLVVPPRPPHTPGLFGRPSPRDFSEVRVRKFRTLKTLRTRTQRVCLFTHLFSKEANISQKIAVYTSLEMLVLVSENLKRLKR